MRAANQRYPEWVSEGWRIEGTLLDGNPRLKLTHLGYLIGAGYFSSEEGVKQALLRHGGPDWASFLREPESLPPAS